MQIEQENQIFPDVLVFLDRAIPDALAYYRFLNLPEDEELKEAFRTGSNKKVFVLDCLSLVKDYARTERYGGAEKYPCFACGSLRIFRLPYHSGSSLEPEEQVDFILKNL